MPSRPIMRAIILPSLLFAALISAPASYAQIKPLGSNLAEKFKTEDLKDKPVYISADSLHIDNEKRQFQYRGNVKVEQADMTLLAEIMSGSYSEKNQIEKIVATKNVTISKGATIKASSQRAEYDAQSAIVTLTENPQIEQEGSVLSADAIKIYLNENRSEALGQVRVTMIKRPGESATSPLKKKP